MIDGVIVKELKKYEDERGWLAEIYRKDEDEYQPAMSYISITMPGKVRGPHEHVKQTDFFVFAGPGTFEVYLWDRRERSATRDQHMRFEVGEGRPAVVVVPPGVVHGYKCVSEKPAMSINMPDKLYKGEAKKEDIDEIRWEDNQDSPYKIN
ncbi:dTDP-4-dehydrorhamnose 3,5-epimerase [Candidatus Falkowbacteria bacterium]|nr:dTDP-4-dehydrorhamnose 3,5-epimerase [Candidatus Falkowbacteria bacterium]